MLMLMFMSLLCSVRTVGISIKHMHKRKSISQSASTNAYVNDVLTEHKHKKKAYAYVAHKLVTLMCMLMLASLLRNGL